MARSAARGLKVIIGNQETWYDCADDLPSSKTKPTLTLPLTPQSSRINGNRSPMDRSPNGFSPGEFDDALYADDTTPSSSSSPVVPQSSAERALAEATMLEETRIAQLAIHLFLNNEITAAKRVLEPKIADNMYASVAYSTILYLQALMTVTADDAKLASKALRDTQSICAKRCRGRFSRSKRTEEQAHAELCHAECGLMLSALVLSEDPGLTALVKAGIRFKSSHRTYQTCMNILRDREWTNPILRGHFESGVRLGNGAFNMIFSCIPSKHAKYLSIVGFSGKAKIGYSELKTGAGLSALRSPLCSMVLIGWETYGKIMLGCGVCDIDSAAEMLNPLLQQYPNGAIMLFLFGRLAQLRGQFSEALDYFQRSINAQTDWKQYQHLCMWESMWCYCFMMQYMPAAKLAYQLFKENQWSKTTYAYLTASFLLMMNQQEANLDGDQVSVNEMMKEVIAKKQRIAGQSIPPEKLAEKRYKRLIEQEKDLIFPAFEMSYIWGGMSALSNRPDIVQDILVLIDAKLAEISRSTTKHHRNRTHPDSVYTLNFLRGVCLSCLNRIDDACAIFDEIVNAEKDIIEDKFLSPNAAVELAHLRLKINDIEGAMAYCTKAMSFKNYFMQAKLELRIGATIELIEEMEEGLLARPVLDQGHSNEFYTPPSSPEPDRKN